MKTKLLLRNNFYNTETFVLVEAGDLLTRRRVRDIRRRLCRVLLPRGVFSTDGDALGRCGPQPRQSLKLEDALLIVFGERILYRVVPT